MACPWDRKQTHATLTRHLIEESYEVLEAIDDLTAAGRVVGGGDPEADAYHHLEEELGDLLFQVVFHAVVAAEAGWFTLADVARGIHDKLVRRHPHVFPPPQAAPGAGTALDPATVIANWEYAKKVEKGRASIMDGIPPALPALLSAAKVGRKAASVGFDWDDLAGVWDKVEEELVELRATIATADSLASGGRDSVASGDGDAFASGGPGGGGGVADELGDVLFTIVSLARHLEVDPEDALRAATTKFRHRFATVEAIAGSSGQDLAGLDAVAWDQLWERAKAAADPDAPTGP